MRILLNKHEKKTKVNKTKQTIGKETVYYIQMCKPNLVFI